MRYGSYATIDAPTSKIDEAEAFLTDQFEAIGASVRRASNSHDFGEYPSFEIDQPRKFNYIDEDEEDSEDNPVNEYEEWIDKANAIEDAYSEKFREYL
jgi:hypothetical protein